MDDLSKTITQSRTFHSTATDALHHCDYKLAESLYKSAIEQMTSILDPMHTDYVDMLKGLMTSLSKQDKHEEAENIQQMIVQLCFGQ